MRNLEEYDLVVIGTGAGLNVAAKAVSAGMKVAVLEEGAIGGTCLNRGCIPSKMLIYPAEVAEAIKTAGKFGIQATYGGIDFKKLVRRVSGTVDGHSQKMLDGLKNSDNPKLYQGTAKFTGARALEVNGKEIRGKKVLVAAGARPFIPPINGLKETPFMTSTEALRLEKQPKSLTVIGGGYIASELAHFFGALGTKITIIERGPLMLSAEDREISMRFTEIFSKKYKVLLEATATKVAYKNDTFSVTYADKEGKENTVESEALLVAVGVVPNTDTLEVEKAGIKTNKRGFVEVNGYLETSAKNVWALGDIAGKYMFRHSANHEAAYTVLNAVRGERVAVDYSAMPHAVFSSPQVAGVGRTEQQLKAEGTPYKVHRMKYSDTAMGGAMLDEEGMVKFLVDEKGERILGCFIIGHEASLLIHEVLVAMKAAGGRVSAITQAVHIHPALNEVVQRAFRH